MYAKYAFDCFRICNVSLRIKFEKNNNFISLIFENFGLWYSFLVLKNPKVTAVTASAA